MRCVEAFDGAPKSSWMMIFCWLFFFFDLLFGRVLIRCCWGALPSFTFYINIFIYGCGSGSRLSLDSRSSGGGRPHRRPIGIRSISALTMTLSSDARDARATLHTKKCQKNHMCITLIFIALTYKSFNYRLLVAKKKKSSGYNDHSGRNLLRSPINMSRCHFILIIQSGVSGFIRPECRSPGRRDRCVALAVATGSITKVFRSRFKFIRSEMLLQCFGE